MANTQTVLKAMATEIITTVKGFDLSECAAVQYDLPQSFFNEMYQSRGWMKACKENDVEESRQAVELAVELLNNTIDAMVEAGTLVVLPAEEVEVVTVATVVSSETTKTAKIIALTEMGLTRKEIAVALNIRVQFVRNVQVKAVAA